jgi:hypothetical protein
VKARKAFDCIEYKRAIQQKHAVENRGLSHEESRSRRAEWLKSSKNPAAALWRHMVMRQETSRKP